MHEHTSRDLEVDAPEQVRAAYSTGIVVIMPRPVAVTCCFLNFLVPGLGTMVSAFTACCCCCRQYRKLNGTEKCVLCSSNFVIGLLQLLTTSLLFVGWIWSCAYGVMFVGMSSQYGMDPEPETQSRANSQRGSVTNVYIHQPMSSEVLHLHMHFSNSTERLSNTDQPPDYQELVDDYTSDSDLDSEDNERPPPYVPP